MVCYKRAALGGDGNDQSFEKSLSDIAHVYIGDKAPSLLKGGNELGFQLIERNDDSTKAIGVVAFDINGIRMFCPVFFLNGEIKGHEMLILPKQRLILPLKEAWLNELMGKKPIVVGESEEDHTKGVIQPDLSRFRDPPYKTASYYQNGIGSAVKWMLNTAGGTLEKTAQIISSKRREVNDILNVRGWTKYADSKGIDSLMKYVKDEPMVERALNSLCGGSDWLKSAYDMSFLRERSNRVFEDKGTRVPFSSSVKQLEEWLQPQALRKEAEYVTVISYRATLTSGSPITLSDKEKEKLADEGHLVVDNRSDKSIAHIIESDNCEYKNPETAGIYDVLMNTGKTKKMVIFPITSRRLNSYGPPPCEENRIRGDYVLLDPYDTEIGHHEHKRDIFCSKKYPESDFLKWIDDQPLCQDESLDNKLAIFMTRYGKTLGPYECGQSCGLHSDGVTYYRNREIEVGTPAGSALRETFKNVQVPEDAKVVGYSERYDTLPLGIPGLVKQASLSRSVPMTIQYVGGNYSLNGKKSTSAFNTLETLIKKHDLREKDANYLMKKAQANRGNTYRAQIKLAYSPSTDPRSNLYMPEPQPSSGGYVTSHPAQMSPSDTQIVTTDTASSNNLYSDYTLQDSYGVSPQTDRQSVQNAIQKGQTEVFNVSMIKEMITNSDVIGRAEELSSDLITALSKVGELLFLYYWFGEKFEDAYGSQELGELEGCLRKTFETLGDVILFLKRKALKPITYRGSVPISLKSADQ